MENVKNLIKNQNYIHALDILEKEIKQNPVNGQALSEAGFCYSQLGQLTQAATSFMQASQVNPKDPWLWQHYGYVLYQLGKVTESINALKKAADYDSNDIWLHHQLAFLYYKNKDFASALKYLEIAVALCKDDNVNHLYELFSLKALIYEEFDPEKSLNVYFSIINAFEDDASAYDKAANLVIDKFNFSNQLRKLNISDPEYNKATHFFRNGDVDEAITLYKKVLNKDKYCYPAYLGIAQALYEKRFGIRQINNIEAQTGISNLFHNYDQLNRIEKNIINSSVAPLGNFVGKLIENDSHFIIVPIDVKLTDFPANKYLKNKKYLRGMPYCTLRGIGGTNAYVGIERLRDLTWNIPDGVNFAPACVAHEFGHQVWCLLNEDIQSEVDKYYNDSKKSGKFISNYAGWSLEEYFAEYYAYYARSFAVNSDISEDDPMIRVINNLKDYNF